MGRYRPAELLKGATLDNNVQTQTDSLIMARHARLAF